MGFVPGTTYISVVKIGQEMQPGYMVKEKAKIKKQEKLRYVRSYVFV